MPKGNSDFTLALTQFQGVNTAFSETRIPLPNAKEAVNLMLYPDSSWNTRWGTKDFFTNFSAKVDGHYEYDKSDGVTRELIAVSGGTVYRCDTVAGTKAAISGATFTAGKKVYFLQISNYLYIGTGYDALARYDGAVLTTYSALATPTGLANTLTTLTAGGYNYYYRVSAMNAIGETLASTELLVSVSLPREQWSTLSPAGKVNLTWTAVPGAVQYNIYADTASGYGKLMDNTANTAYADNGAAVLNPYVQPPVNDTTIGPKLGPMCLSGNRIWGITFSEPWTVYFSGSGTYLGNFAPAFGGGWLRIEYGGRSRCMGIIPYQGLPHVIMNTPDGKGDVWNVTIDQQTIDNSTFSVPLPAKLIGSVGTPSPASVLAVENDVTFFNIFKIGVMGNEPGVLNVLRVNELSRVIRNIVFGVDQAYLGNICSYYYDRKIFYSFPIGSSTGDPNQVWVFDRELVQWYGPWTIGFNQFGQFTDANQQNHFIASVGTKIVEISPSNLGDSGVAFTQRYTSPRIQVNSKDFTKFARHKYAWYRLRNFFGNAQLTVFGTIKKQPIKALQQRSIQSLSGSSNSGWGNDMWSDFEFSTSNGIPSILADESLIKELRVNKMVRDVQYSVQSTGLTDKWALTGLESLLFPIDTRTPADWRN